MNSMTHEDVFNGWSNPDTYHFYNWLSETEDRFITALECDSIPDMKEFFTKQSDIPNGIELEDVNWFELWDSLHYEL
jgi:hypothetical protein